MNQVQTHTPTCKMTAFFSGKITKRNDPPSRNNYRKKRDQILFGLPQKVSSKKRDFDC